MDSRVPEEDGIHNVFCKLWHTR